MSAKGTMRNNGGIEVKELMKNMTHNEYWALIEVREEREYSRYRLTSNVVVLCV